MTRHSASKPVSHASYSSPTLTVAPSFCHHPQHAQRTIFVAAASGSCNGRASAFGSHTSRMQELVLTRPGTAAQTEWTREPDSEPVAALDLRREFEERLAECGPLAYRVARGVLRNSADAEDVAQEALLRAYRRFERLRDRARFRAWLVRIAFRLAIDRVRSSKRREVRETLWSQTSPRPSTEDLAATSEFQEHLDRAMDGLPEKHRLVLLLSAMQGHSLEEVAEM